MRRIERLFDKGKNLKFVNKKILNFLNRFLKKLVIFKDKFNAKPPGGEGFNFHIMMGSFILKIKIIKIKRDGMSTVIILLMF